MTGDLTDLVGGIVHEPTQTEGPGLDLTLADVSEVTGAGRVDFGGGELEPADREPVSTSVRNEDDEYGWYDLAAGQYLIAFDERLVDEEPVWIQTRDALRQAGAVHPTLRVSSLDPVPLAVGGDGIRLKENARVSTLFQR